MRANAPRRTADGSGGLIDMWPQTPLGTLGGLVADARRPADLRGVAVTSVDSSCRRA